MIAVVAIMVIGPKELPRALRAVGQWIGKARAMTREFQNSVNDMINESEFEELRKTANSMGDFSASNILDSNSATNTVTPPPPTPQKWPPADAAAADATDDLGDDYDASPEEIEQWEADQARPDIIDDGEIDGDDADKPSDETDKISDNKSDETSDTKVTDA